MRVTNRIRTMNVEKGQSRTFEPEQSVKPKLWSERWRRSWRGSFNSSQSWSIVKNALCNNSQVLITFFIGNKWADCNASWKMRPSPSTWVAYTGLWTMFNAARLWISVLSPFNRGGPGVGLEPGPSLEPVLCVRPAKELDLGHENLFQRSTDTSLV